MVILVWAYLLWEGCQGKCKVGQFPKCTLLNRSWSSWFWHIYCGRTARASVRWGIILNQSWSSWSWPTNRVRAASVSKCKATWIFHLSPVLLLASLSLGQQHGLSLGTWDSHHFTSKKIFSLWMTVKSGNGTLRPKLAPTILWVKKEEEEKLLCE